MSSARANWKRLRIKTDATTDDHDWVGNAVTPNRLTFVVGGTTTAGVYSLRFVGKVYGKLGNPDAQFDVDFTATITRAAETDAQIASDLNSDIGTGVIATGSPVLLSDVGITSSVNSATLTVLFPPGAVITVTRTAPAPGTIVGALGDVVPIIASAPHFAGAGESSMNGVVVCVNGLNSSNVLVPVGTGTQPTVTLEAVEICEVEIPATATAAASYFYRYARTTQLTGCVLGNEYQLPMRGAKYWTARIVTDADLVATTTQLEVIYRDAAT